VIDTATLKRDAQADIADWPVLIRHYYDGVSYVEVVAGLNTEDDLSVLQAGGLLDDVSMGIIAIADDFAVHGLPKSRDRVDLQLRDASWKRLEVKRTPDFYDPLAATIQFTIGSPDT
jgi:hypothetical protein